MKSEIRQSGLRKLLVTGIATATLILSACDSAVLIDPTATNIADPDQVDLITRAESAGNFTTLLAALETAGLRETLADPNSTFTVFAPTDDAFAVLGDDGIADLLASDTLADTLSYHVFSGSKDSTEIAANVGSTITMLDGNEAAITQDGDQILINNANITAVDIMASNGIIHVIDAVMTPPEGATENPTDNLSQLISSDPQFTTLATALQATDLVDTLAADGEFTVFAPSNAAFDALEDGVLDDLLANTDELRNLLLNHVVQGQSLDAVAVNAAVNSELTSAAATPLTISLNGETLMVNSASIVRADVFAANGVIHEIDAVIPLPVAPTESIVQVLQSKSEYSALVSAIQSAGLEAELNDVNAKLTVFAPTNAAMESANLTAGLPGDPAALAALLRGHVHSGMLTAQNLEELSGGTLGMLSGSTTSIALAGTDVTIDSAVIVEKDIQAANGVIHGIDAVIMP